MDRDEAGAGGGGRGRGGKYLAFVLAGEEYGIGILAVREIMGMMPVTAVPRTPPFVRGVVNLRGKVIPVIDLRLKFGMEAAEETESTCIIFVDAGGIEMGVVVDQVSDVLDIAEKDIEETPAFGFFVDTAFIPGIAKRGDKVTILLDIAAVLTAAGSEVVRKAAAAESGVKGR